VIGDTLLMLCVLAMFGLLCRSEQTKKSKIIPLPHFVTESKIADILSSTFKYALEKLATTPLGFSVQLCQNTKVSDYSHLLVLVCYLHDNATRVLTILMFQYN
jgi:hypothetical protein